MNQEDTQKIIERIKKFTKEVTSSKEKALQTLVDAGLAKPNGQPTDLYKEDKPLNVRDHGNGCSKNITY
jgi:hypothetical protein